MRFPAVLPVLLACASALPLAAQDLGALDQQRGQMLRALSEWDRADSNLERDAYRLPAGDVLPRIDATEQKRLALNVALSRYSESLRTTLRARRADLKADQPVTLEGLANMARQHTADAQAALALLDAQRRRLKLSDRARQEEVEVSRTQLTRLLDTLARHAAELATGETPELLARARAAVLSDALQLEAAIDVKDPSDYTRLYAAMKTEVKRRASGGTAQLASSAPMIGAAQLVVPSLDGLWVYSNPDAKKNGDSYEWKYAKADIHQNGDKVEGTYECVYAVPEGEKYNPVVKLSFSGSIQSEVMIFKLQSPLKGWFQVVKFAAGEMNIAYGIENAAKNGISFGEIPVDAPQRLGRQAR